MQMFMANICTFEFSAKCNLVYRRPAARRSRPQLDTPRRRYADANCIVKFELGRRELCSTSFLASHALRYNVICFCEKVNPLFISAVHYLCLSYTNINN